MYLKVYTKKPLNKAQSIIEYVAVIMVLIAVFIAMGVYYKRSLQGRYRQAGDALSAGAQVDERTMKQGLEKVGVTTFRFESSWER